MASEMLKRLTTVNAADGPLPESTGGPDVGNAELLAGFVGLLFVGVTRTKIEGGPSPEPMEVWHCLDAPQDTARARTIRGRAQLSARLRFAAQDLGMAFQPIGSGAEQVDQRTGEVKKLPPCSLPSGVGAWSLVDQKTGAPCAIFAEVAIDPKAGRAAGAGRGFAYLARDVRAVRMAQARAAYPAIESVQVGALTLTYDAHDTPALPYAGEAELENDDDHTEAPAPSKVPAKAGGKRGR